MSQQSPCVAYLLKKRTFAKRFDFTRVELNELVILPFHGREAISVLEAVHDSDFDFKLLQRSAQTFLLLPARTYRSLLGPFHKMDLLPTS